jgi:hypothetical protein
MVLGFLWSAAGLVTVIMMKRSGFAVSGLGIGPTVAILSGAGSMLAGVIIALCRDTLAETPDHEQVGRVSAEAVEGILIEPTASPEEALEEFAPEGPVDAGSALAGFETGETVSLEQALEAAAQAAAPGEETEQAEALSGAIRFECSCGNPIIVESRYAGMKGRCTRCGEVLTIPAR